MGKSREGKGYDDMKIECDMCGAQRPETGMRPCHAYAQPPGEWSVLILCEICRAIAHGGKLLALKTSNVNTKGEKENR